MSYKTQEMVVVTGTSSGIGRATAEQLAAEGFHVLAGVRRQEDADKIKQKNIEPVILDITAIDTLRALAERVEQDPLGRPLRAVVNNMPALPLMHLLRWFRWMNFAVRSKSV